MTSHNGPSSGAGPTGVTAGRDAQGPDVSGAPGGAMSQVPPGGPQSHGAQGAGASQVKVDHAELNTIIDTLLDVRHNIRPNMPDFGIKPVNLKESQIEMLVECS